MIRAEIANKLTAISNMGEADYDELGNVMFGYVWTIDDAIVKAQTCLKIAKKMCEDFAESEKLLRQAKAEENERINKNAGENPG